MNRKYNPALRIISTIVLSFFLWTFGGVFDIAYAIKSSDGLWVTGDGRKTAQAEKPEEKLQKALEDIENILITTVTDTGTKKNKLKTKKTEIEALDVEIRKQFRETEENIKALPEVIKQRHRDFIKKYDENVNELKTNLDAIEKAKTKEQTDKEIEKSKKFLEKVRPPKKHIPLDPNKLPHRTVEPGEILFEELTPAQAKVLESEHAETERNALSAFVPEPKGIQVATNGSLSGLLTVATANLSAGQTALPTAADLSETVDIQFPLPYRQRHRS